jgi:aspartate/glutamate racemase
MSFAAHKIWPAGHAGSPGGGSKEPVTNTASVLLPNLQRIAGNDYSIATVETVKEFIESVRVNLRKDYSFVLFDFGFQPLSFALVYNRLQQAIAEVIHEEHKRPTFVFCLANGIKLRKLNQSELKNNDTINKFGLVGGCGPLADAELLVQIQNVISKSENQQGKWLLYVLSPPVPRDFSSTIQALLNPEGYKARILEFLDLGFSNFSVASNTAHVHLGAITALTQRSHSQLHNLTDEVCNYLKDNILSYRHGEKKVLILGTVKAYDAGLYDRLFEKFKIDYAKVCNATLLMEKQSAVDLYKKQVQEFINKVKSKLVTDIERQEMTMKIYSYAKANKCRFVLLGCSELGFGLGSENIKFLLKEGVEVIDTEIIFAQVIASRLDPTCEPEYLGLRPSRRAEIGHIVTTIPKAWTAGLAISSSSSSSSSSSQYNREAEDLISKFVGVEGLGDIGLRLPRTQRSSDVNNATTPYRSARKNNSSQMSAALSSSDSSMSSAHTYTSNLSSRQVSPAKSQQASPGVSRALNWDADD